MTRSLVVLLNVRSGGGNDAALAARVATLFERAGARADVRLVHGGELAGALRAAIERIARGEVRRVDVGEVNGRVFVNNSSLGLYPDIVRERERQQRRLGRGKWAAFVWASIAALKRFPFLGVRLSIDGRAATRRTPFVFIGNNVYSMQGFTIGERERLDAGCLSLYVAQRAGRLKLLMLALHALFGRLEQARDFDALSAAGIDVESKRKRLRVATDGEITTMTPPLRYRTRPASLLVVAGEPPALS